MYVVIASQAMSTFRYVEGHVEMSGPMRTRILIVDDHDLVREGVRLLLAREPDLEVVGDAASGEAAIEQAELLEPDVVLMDVRMPGMGGIEATRRLRGLRPSIRVLILSAFPDHLIEALTAGAAGYLLKSGCSRQLLAGVRSVALGATVIQGELAQEALFGKVRHGDGLAPLTPREVDILRLVAHGLTNRTIARQAGIAPRTADQHVHNILVKIGVKSRSAAIRYAIEHEVLPAASA
jgi:DNA-binding NarL/FixJ family response regulator